MTHPLFASGSPVAPQLRLLGLTLLLWGATVAMQQERSAVEGWSSVFTQPPAYLHPPEAIGFDVSGVPRGGDGPIEAALFASVRSAADHGTRAHTHMSLAVYYKLSGQRALAEREKRKGDYWWRVAKF